MHAVLVVEHCPDTRTLGALVQVQYALTKPFCPSLSGVNTAKRSVSDPVSCLIIGAGGGLLVPLLCF